MDDVKEQYNYSLLLLPVQPQYVFIHDAILESIECGETEVVARDLLDQYRKLGMLDPVLSKTGLQIEFEVH